LQSPSLASAGDTCVGVEYGDARGIAEALCKMSPALPFTECG
jgi:hypothetical protein